MVKKIKKKESEVYSIRLSEEYSCLLEKQSDKISIRPAEFIKKTVMAKLDKSKLEFEKKKIDYFLK